MYWVSRLPDWQSSRNYIDEGENKNRRDDAVISIEGREVVVINLGCVGSCLQSRH